MRKATRDAVLAFILSMMMFFFGFLFGQRWASYPPPAGHPRVRMELAEEPEGIEEIPFTFHKILERETGKSPEKSEIKEIQEKRARYSVQVASYRTEEKALSHLKALRKKGYKDVYIQAVDIEGKGMWYRVRFGHFNKKEEAQNVAVKMNEGGGRKVFVVKLE